MSTDDQTLSRDWNPWDSIPENYNLGVDLTTQQVRTGHATKSAILWENAVGDKRSLTYGELDQLSTRLACSLNAMGIERGDRVFLRLPNIPEFYISALAVAKIGAVFIPSSTQFRAGEIQYRLQDSSAVAVITTAGLLGDVTEIAENCKELKHVIVTAYPDPTLPLADCIDFASLITEPVSDRLQQWQPAETRNDDIAFIAYTSGTTGDPKGVVHYHRYPRAYDSLVRFWHDYRNDDVVACPAELGWLLPVASTFLYALSRGLTIVLYDNMGQKFDPATWFRLFQDYRITNFTATPTIYRMMMAAAEQASEFDMSSWRHAVTAGEPLPADTFDSIKDHFGVQPLDGIGMSECMVYCANLVGNETRPGSCGCPTPGTVIELMDDQMNPVPNNTEGVLCVRIDSHPGMMREYWNKPDQTAEIFQGQWYVSGDVLVRDDDGYFWFKGRADDVIKASGYRISPFEIESCLCSHPAVLEAAAVAAPDAMRGTVVVAYIIPRAGIVADDALVCEIQQYVKDNIAPYKYPRHVHFVSALPKTTSGKTKRRVLRDQEQSARSTPN
ncbi:MAG: acyl-CoA synthetase [Pirellulaceae bacterium]|nr:acyl-CoA synthetase [Pirellulaceae bacterium]